MGRGLSEKQTHILEVMKAEEAKGRVTTRATLLNQVYGLKSMWKPEYEKARLRHSGQNYLANWNDNYNSANASLTRSLRRLEERGLIKYTYYTPLGVEGEANAKWGYFVAEHIDPETEELLEAERQKVMRRLDAQLRRMR